MTAVAFAAFSRSGVSSATEALAIPVRISVAMHEGCPKTPTLRERLEAHLGPVPAPAEGASAIDIALQIEKRADLSVGRLTLTASGASVEREASSTSCEDVVAALTIMAVIAIGEQAERLVPETTEPPEPSRTPSSREAPSDGSNHRPQETRAPRAGHPVPATSASRRFELSVGSALEVNGDRDAVVFGTWFAQIAFPIALAPTLRLGLARSTSERVSVPRGAIAMHWIELAWAACVDVHRDRRFRVGPCLNGELGSLEASVVRPLPVREISTSWISTGASVRMSWRLLPPLRVEVMAGARAPLIRRELYFEPFDGTVAYRAPVLAPFAQVGFIVDFP